MKQVLLLLFVCVFCFSAKAEEKFHPATVTFYDGGQFSGLARFNGRHDIEFKISEEDTKERLDGYVIKRIRFHVEPYNVFEYVYHKNRYKLLQKIAEGSLTLYAQFNEPINDQITLDQYERATLDRIDVQRSPNAPLSDMGLRQAISSQLFHKKVRYYIKKTSSTTIADIKLNFREEAKQWFKDCPEIIEYTDSREWRYKDLKQIVEFYNEFCGQE